MPNIKLLLLCLGAIPAVAAPAMAQKVEYDARFPARNREAAELKSLAVLPFRGADGEAFTSAMIGSLQSSTLDGKPYFYVKTLEGMNYAPPAPPPPPPSKGKGRRKAAAVVVPAPTNEVAAAVRLGQRLSVAAIYTGEVAGAVISRRNFTQSKSVCQKKSDGKCEMVQVPVACVDTTVNYSVTPRIINVATGQVVYSRTVAKSGNYVLCDGKVEYQGTLADAVSDFGKSFTGMFKRTKKKNPNEADVEEKEISTDAALLTKVRSDVADAVRYDVSPYNFKVTVEFKQKAPELNKEDQAKFRSASEFAKVKRLDRACSDWESMNTPANSGSINLLFNLGVCQEVLVPEDPTSAMTFLAKADSLTTKPDSMINAALERVRKMTDAQTEISRQLTPKGTKN
jgi:hypothetical protein